MHSITRILVALVVLLGIGRLYAEECIFDDILEHKQKSIQEIVSDPLRGGNPSYPLFRVLKTVYADDADYIPKIVGAGQFFEENGIKYQLMHNGIKVIKHGYYGAWMSDIIYTLRGHHEPQEEKVFYEILQHIPPNATMVELGSYWGYYSLWFSKTIPQANNWLIEPDPSCMALGLTNFALNKKKGHFSLGYIQMRDADPHTFIRAKRIYIDTFLREKGIEHVNILHSDIQGAEYEMLLTCEESLKNRKIDYLFISTHSPEIHQACKNLLITSDYFIVSEHDMAESCSYDGLLVARRSEITGPTYIPVKKYTDD